MRCTIIILLMATCTPLAAAEWGDLTMRFVYDGAPPKPEREPLAVGPAVAGCGAAPVLQSRLLVNAKDKGVANVCVWLLRTKGDAPPPIHESYAKSAKDKVTMTNRGCLFEPKVLVVRTTQTFVGANADATGHNMKADFFNAANPSFNQTIPAGGTMEKALPAVESSPTPIACGIHPWMRGYLMVRDDPYAAVSDAGGKLTIKNLPSGEWAFVVWHETGYITKAKQAGKPLDWGRNGRTKVVIKPGANDRGEFLLPPDEFP